MKVMIENDMKIFDDEITDELECVLKDSGISFSAEIGHDIYKNIYIKIWTIFAQKITLDELDMNEFLYELSMSVDTMNVEYSALGGHGCDVCLSVSIENKIF